MASWRREAAETRSFTRSRLAVEPDVFHAPAIVLAVDHDGQTLDLRLHTSCQARVVDDRPRPVFLQSLVNLPNQAPALFPIGDRRLLDEQFFQLRIAIAGIIALR